MVLLYDSATHICAYLHDMWMKSTAGIPQTSGVGTVLSHVTTILVLHRNTAAVHGGLVYRGADTARPVSSDPEIMSNF